MAGERATQIDDGWQPQNLEALVGYNLKRAYILFQTDLRHVLEADALSIRSFAALSLVVETPHITQSTLARRMGIERSGLVAVVDDLEARGFLWRTEVPGDRRVQALVPQPAGVKAYQTALARVEEHENRLLSGLSPKEQTDLIALLQKLRKTISTQDDTA